MARHEGLTSGLETKFRPGWLAKAWAHRPFQLRFLRATLNCCRLAEPHHILWSSWVLVKFTLALVSSMLLVKDAPGKAPWPN